MPEGVRDADAARWHLLVNASEALRGVAERRQAQIRDPTRLRAPPVPTPPVPVVTPLVPAEGDRRRARFETVARLRAEGLPINEAARRVGVARNAVRRWLRAGEFVPCRRTPPTSLLHPHLLLVVQRWQLGLRNSAELHCELGGRGFEGGHDAARRRPVSLPGS